MNAVKKRIIQIKGRSILFHNVPITVQMMLISKDWNIQLYMIIYDTIYSLLTAIYLHIVARLELKQSYISDLLQMGFAAMKHKI